VGMPTNRADLQRSDVANCAVATTGCSCYIDSSYRLAADHVTHHVVLRCCESGSHGNVVQELWA
jgi:hypothetical protein